MAEPVRYLETSDVARELGMSYSGVYAIIAAGGLWPDAVSKRGVRYFLPETVAAFKAKRAAAQASR